MSEQDNDNTSQASVQLITVDTDDAGQRLDNWLTSRLKGVPKSKIYNIVRKGEVRVNKKRAKPLQKLAAGDSIRIPPIRVTSKADAPKASRTKLQALADAIIYEDSDLIVINKPFGWAVHGGSGINLGVIEALRQLRPDDKRLELVHRLDRDTSGLLMISKRRAILKQLHEALKNKKHIEKRYIALVYGRWPTRRQRVDAPLLKYSVASGERMVRVSQDGKRSLTEFSVIKRFEGYTLVNAWPITGRTHQIRVHCLHAGFPIAGDPKYAHRLNEAEHSPVNRLFLHAEYLKIKWPDGRVSEFKAPLAPELEDYVKQLDQPSQ